MEKFFIFDNILASPELLFSSDEYREVSTIFIRNGRLKGPFREISITRR